MLIFTVVLLVLVILAVSYIFMVMPRVTDGADMDLQCADYAHRGLHGGTLPENSLPAFVAARDLGYGIELDLRMSADGEIFVFHDDSLLRMCGVKKSISAMKAAEVRSLFLSGTANRIPTLKEVLSLIDGQVPLLIEIKPDVNTPALCKRLCLIMDGYSGAFAVESCDPAVLIFFRKYRPRYARGQLVAKFTPKDAAKDARIPKNRFKLFALTHLFTNVATRPDFIAIDGRLMREPAFLLSTRLFKRIGFVWTVRTKWQYELCRKQGLYAIFENIEP